MEQPFTVNLASSSVPFPSLYNSDHCGLLYSPLNHLHSWKESGMNINLSPRADFLGFGSPGDDEPEPEKGKWSIPSCGV